MCGIVGYVGAQQAAPILLEGLQKLEYRGYDSAGIAVLDGSTIELAKACGEIKNLLAKTHDGSDLHGYIASAIRAGQRTARRRRRMPIRT